MEPGPIFNLPPPGIGQLPPGAINQFVGINDAVNLADHFSVPWFALTWFTSNIPLTNNHGCITVGAKTHDLPFPLATFRSSISPQR